MIMTGFGRFLLAIVFIYVIHGCFYLFKSGWFSKIVILGRILLFIRER